MPIRFLKIRMITQDSPMVHAPDDVASRLNQLNAAFATAEQLRPVTPIQMGPNGIPVPPPVPQDVLDMYLAPEYFFRKNRNRCQLARQGTAYSEQEKNTIVAALTQMSQQGPAGCLVIAGTILWVVSITGGWQVRNTSYVLHNGALLLEYDKQHDCNELETFEKIGTGGVHAFLPGITPGLFNVAGLNCGIETCVDHSMLQLARRDKQRNLDLQFITSNVTTVERSGIAVHPRGYVVHCNAGNFGARVYRNPFEDSGDIGPPECGTDALQRHAFFDLPFPSIPVPAAAAARLHMKN